MLSRHKLIMVEETSLHAWKAMILHFQLAPSNHEPCNRIERQHDPLVSHETKVRTRFGEGASRIRWGHPAYLEFWELVQLIRMPHLKVY